MTSLLWVLPFYSILEKVVVIEFGIKIIYKPLDREGIDIPDYLHDSMRSNENERKSREPSPGSSYVHDYASFKIKVMYYSCLMPYTSTEIKGIYLMHFVSRFTCSVSPSTMGFHF